MKKEINVVGAVVTNDGKILSARRSEYVLARHVGVPRWQN